MLVKILFAKSIFLVYVRKSDNPPLPKFTSIVMTNQPVHIFASHTHLRKHVGFLPSWLSQLISTLGNSPIQYILPKYENSVLVGSIIGYIPASKKLKESLQEIKEPLMAFYNHLVVHQEGSPTIVSKIDDKDIIIHEIDEVVDKILPTLIDCTESNKITIKRPGPISKQDLQRITGNKIKIVQNYLDKSTANHMEIFRIKVKPNIKSKTIIIGTKEKLKEIFEINKVGHFNLIESDNFILINLGSITNPENILTQLSKNINRAKEFGLPNIYWLENKWPSNNWGEILRFVFTNITKNLPQTDIDSSSDQNYLQSLKKFATSLV